MGERPAAPAVNLSFTRSSDHGAERTGTGFVMLGAVFGKNYRYLNAKAMGDSYRFASTNQLALTRKNSADMLTDALSNAAWQADQLALQAAKKSSGGTTTTLVDIFA